MPVNDSAIKSLVVSPERTTAGSKEGRTLTAQPIRPALKLSSAGGEASAMLAQIRFCTTAYPMPSSPTPTTGGSGINANIK